MRRNNTYVFDPKSPELGKLINQDRLITNAIGGPLAGLPDPSPSNSIYAILDVASGPGSWVLDVAFTHPEIKVAGVDICLSTVEHAWARARTQDYTCTSIPDPRLRWIPPDLYSVLREVRLASEGGVEVEARLATFLGNPFIFQWS